MCGTYQPTNVISLSYSAAEAAYSPFYAKRQCEEYLKLSLRGTSIFYSSGDVGVVSRFGVDGCLEGNKYNPGFPPSCPYVTTVGGTQVSFGLTYLA
jgi:tripeptidyl-peptidase-1